MSEKIKKHTSAAQLHFQHILQYFPHDTELQLVLFNIIINYYYPY